MVIKKDLIIAVLATFCLTVTIFMIMPIKSAYDPWLDYNHDGKIDMKDIGAMAKSFGLSGDPTVNVTVVPCPSISLWIYSIPFIVSGNPDLVHPSTVGLGPGVYETDILIHNPSPSITYSIGKKIIVARPENQTVPSPTYIGTVALGPDQDFRIDSNEIWSYVGLIPPYTVKGFVCINSTSPYLDVFAFYTVSEIIPGAHAGLYTVGNTTSIESLTITPKPY